MPINDSIVNIESVDTVAKVAELGPAASPTVIVIRDTIVQQTQELAPPIEQTSSITDFSLSAYVVLGVTLLGLAIFFLLKFTKIYLVPVVAQRYKKREIKQLWYKITVIVWLIFSLFALYLLLKASVLITALMLAITGIIFSQFLVDYLAGIYFRFDGHLKRKDQFVFGEIKGEVSAFKSRQLIITTAKGEDIYIPFRNLLNQPWRIVKEVNNLLEKKFTVSLTGAPSKALMQIEKHLLMCPWILNQNQWQVEPLGEEQYEISVNVKTSNVALKIQTYLKEKLG